MNSEGFKETEIGWIPEDWKLGEIQDVSLVKGRIGWRGYTKKDLCASGPLVLGASQISKNNEIDLSKPVFILREKYEESPEIMLEKHDILIVKVGNTIGKVAIIRNEIGEATLNPNCVVLKDVKIDNYYLFYYLLTDHAQYYLINSSAASAQPAINQKDIKLLPIPIPTINEQKSISKILSAIDLKIQLNHNMNQTLEEIGQVIFRHWFVDFEFPNEDGNPYKSSGGDMVDSKLGLIPQGWEVRKLKDCVEIIIDHRGKTPTKLGSNWSSSGIRALSAKNVKKRKIVNEESIKYVDEELYSKWMKDEIKREDIILTSEAPLGEFVSWDYDEKIVLSQRLFGIRANKQLIYPKYLYCFMNSGLFKYELKSRATGSTVQGIRQAELMKTNILVPPLKLTNQFQNLIITFFNKITINEDASRNLSQIRDSILPKLMSGKIRVKPTS